MSEYKIGNDLREYAKKVEAMCKESYNVVDEICEYNEEKMLNAFRENNVSETHFAPSTGYGYSDRGRDVLDSVFAHAVGAEDALVRHNFVSGTHALSVALFGVLRPNDVMLSITGAVYDTMQEVIGIRGEGNGSLKDFGIKYEQIELTEGGTIDYSALKDAVNGVRAVYIQRSRGYSLRRSLTIADIKEAVDFVKKIDENIMVIVDNCYGEFVEKCEPTAVGADLIIGSLIKNPGGAIAKTGGYIAGKEKLVELCSYRLTAVGMGKEVGCTLETKRDMFMGLFFAPSVVAAAVKTSIFATKLFEELGFATFPKFDEKRTDIIAAIELVNAENLIAFCRGIQKGSPIDAFVTPEPWAMPGYDSEVIMAAGAFTGGASIEISADAPLREPFAVWVQGGITYNSGKLAILTAAQEMIKLGAVSI